MASNERRQRSEVTVEGLPEEPELDPGTARALLDILLKAHARLQDQEATEVAAADAGSTAQRRDVR